MSAPAPIHLRPATDLAPRVLLPGDPHRALAVAQAILEKPLMFNHARGLWGYTGRARDGEPLTVQSTGMGGPSAAIVIEELIALGARQLIRIGTCGALVPDLELGDLVVAKAALAADGTSSALGAGDRLVPDRDLTDALADAGARRAVVASTDLFYDPRPDPDPRAAGADVIEMEAATLLALAGRHDVAAAVLLGVTDELAGEARRRIECEELEQLGIALGETAWAALAAQAAS